VKLKNDGFAESTLKNFGKWYRVLSANCDLNDPESVRAYIADLNKSPDYKRNLIACYDHFAKFYKITWERPKYKTTGFCLETRSGILITGTTINLHETIVETNIIQLN